MDILEGPLTLIWYLLQCGLLIIGKIGIPVIIVTLCAIIVKRIWKGKEPKTKEE